MKNKNSMKKRINLQFMMVAAGAILFISISSTLLFYTIFKNQVYDDLKAYAHVLCEIDDRNLFQDMNYNPQEDDLRITLTDAEGWVTYDSIADQETMVNHKERPEIRRAMEHGEGMAIRTSDTMSMHTLYYAIRLPEGNILRIGKDSGRIYHILRNTVLLVLVLSVITLGICILLSHFLTKRLLTPIEELTENLNGTGREEIYMEIQPFVQRIKEQHINLLNNARIRQEFTANVSHELKTPLTAISGYAELIGSGMAGEKDAAHFAKEICQSSERLLTLINDIMKLSELDETDVFHEKESMDLYMAALGCLDMMELQAQKHNVTLSLIGKSCTIHANKSLMDELLYNLCSNAIRYNNRGGSVVVSVLQEERGILLSVKDTGIGIPKEHQERVFERFYRVDKSRSKQSGGTGLGLAIVKHIVAQHDAEMELISEKGKGTEVKIWF